MSRFYQALREANRAGTVGAGEIPSVERPGGNSLADDYVRAAKIGQAAPKPQAHSQEEELAAAGAALPERGLFPISSKAKLDHHARVIPNAVDQAVVEHYRRLRTKLVQQQEAKPFRTLMVTSASPQEGKTVTVLNLGLSFAMLPDFKVLVVDGDIRRGSMGKWLGADENWGLSNVIDGSADLEEVVLKNDDLPVYFIPRGNSRVPPAELLHSPGLRNCFQSMSEYFSLVLVDSPPVNLVTDAQLLAASCDAVLLVVRAFMTTRKSLERTVQDLQNFRVLGTILNCGTQAQLIGRYKGYY
jgi:capsular exopolysaccharide synthesis family protein